MKQVDTFYFNRDKMSYREVELTFNELNPPDTLLYLTSYAIYLSDIDAYGKMLKADAHYIPMKPDRSLVDSSHLKHGTGQPKEQWRYIYNSKGEKEKSEYYARNDGEDLRLGWRTVYSYDKRKNVTEEMCYYNNGDALKSTYQYSRKGVRLSKTQYTLRDTASRFDMKIRYTYNKQKDIEAEECTNVLGEVYSKKRYEYVYNDDGHWVKKLEYRNGKLNNIVEQEFEYYEHAVIHNELWWHYVPLIAARGSDGVYALYLYDDGSFVEDSIATITAKKTTRRGRYRYHPETGELHLTYTDRRGGKDVLHSPHYISPKEMKQPEEFRAVSMFEIVKIKKGRKPIPYKISIPN